MRASHAVWLAVWLALMMGALGCGGEPEACEFPLELVAVERATAADVAPILDRSCALGGCHLTGPGAGGLVLGRTSAAWRAALVNVPSQQNPSMMLVTPGDPDNSWLVRKLLGEFCEVSCARGGCGGAMPPGTPLSEAERATILAWIAEGAQ